MASPQNTSSSSETLSRNSASVLVSNHLLELIKDPTHTSKETSPLCDSTFAHLTMDELLMQFKNYIIKNNLYDQNNPLKILLKENELGSLLGKSEFSLHDFRDILFEKLVYPVNKNSSEVSRISSINDKMCLSKKRKLCENNDSEVSSKKSKSFYDTSCDSEESMYSFQDYETEFVTDSDAESIAIENFRGSIDGVIIAETYDVEYEIEAPEGEFSCESDSELEDMVKTAIIKFIARSSDSDIEYLADESSDDDEFEKEISEEDKWQCFSCHTINDPLMRHCAACWRDRDGWLSDSTHSPHTHKDLIERREKISTRGKRKLPSKKSTIKYKDISDRKQCSSEDRILSSSSSTCNDVQTPSNPMHEVDKDHIPKTELDKQLCLFCCEKPADSTIIHSRFGCNVTCRECGRKLMRETHAGEKKRCPVCRRLIEKIVFCFN